MMLCKLSGVEEGGGDYIVLGDYGYDGLAVQSQHKTLEEAIGTIYGSNYFAAIVKICQFEVREEI